jgi:Sulfotransferase domain
MSGRLKHRRSPRHSCFGNVKVLFLQGVRSSILCFTSHNAALRHPARPGSTSVQAIMGPFRASFSDGGDACVLQRVWLASYPRSGNTMLRTVLSHALGCGLRAFIRRSGRQPRTGALRGPIDDSPAIYVIRDGRAACVSLWRFCSGNIPLDAVIEGRHRFGTWSAHLEAWDPWNRPNTLFLKYEDMRHDVTQVLPKISAFLQRDILNRSIPDRRTISQVDGRWVREESDWTSSLPQDLLMRFSALNHSMLVKAGYLSHA